MPVLDPQQIFEPQAAARNASIALKTQLLTELVTEVLQLHDSNFSVFSLTPPDFLKSIASERDTRLDVMGRPCRYAEITLTGRDPVTYEEDYVFTDVFEIFVGFGTGTGPDGPFDAATYQAAVTAWRSVIGAAGVWDGLAWTEPPGLVTALRKQEVMCSENPDDPPVQITEVRDAEYTYARPDPQNPDDRLDLTLTVLLS